MGSEGEGEVVSFLIPWHLHPGWLTEPPSFLAPRSRLDIYVSPPEERATTLRSCSEHTLLHGVHDGDAASYKRRKHQKFLLGLGILMFSCGI